MGCVFCGGGGKLIRRVCVSCYNKNPLLAIAPKCDCGQTAVAWRVIEIGTGPMKHRQSDARRLREAVLPLCAACAKIERELDDGSGWLRVLCDEANRQEFNRL